MSRLIGWAHGILQSLASAGLASRAFFVFERNFDIATHVRTAGLRLSPTYETCWTSLVAGAPPYISLLALSVTSKHACRGSKSVAVCSQHICLLGLPRPLRPMHGVDVDQVSAGRMLRLLPSVYQKVGLRCAYMSVNLTLYLQNCVMPMVPCWRMYLIIMECEAQLQSEQVLAYISCLCNGRPHAHMTCPTKPYLTDQSHSNLILKLSTPHTLSSAVRRPSAIRLHCWLLPATSPHSTCVTRIPA